jgi:hypothetical protein
VGHPAGAGQHAPRLSRQPGARHRVHGEARGVPRLADAG